MSAEAILSRQARAPSFRVSRILGRMFIYGILILFAAYYLMPLFVMIVTSLKDMSEIREGNLISLPRTPTLEPWRVAWTEACVGVDCPGIRGFYANTFLMVLPAVTISTLLGALNGFALTKFAFPGHRLVFGLIMFGCFTPYQAILIPMATVLGKLGLSGSLWGLILIHVIYGLPFTTLFFRNYYVSIPQDLVKAARVDGAGFFRIFYHILLPISAPIAIVSVIWQFTNIWNDFLFGASFTYGRNAPIMVALNNIVNTSTGERPYNVQMAAAIMAALPTLVIYIFAGRYFIRGLVAGSVKG
ncbi:MULTISPECIES: carbohydrate ABC transporter permease [Mesorhizobium]|uniref:carbohydrate ABC transporter permease n=1 Tax=Mesorhizobium TaxID=68287 RepID=UPI0009F5B488|nr:MULTISPECIES: carbohydrate ABC transporter permease [Mesorhizobium]PBB52941.1 carbohydrate ABC transporter permease [Mesorhizobium loti]QIA22525.1 carbohydrate ABC transporter permease [Mesorhizobium sp. AA22]